MDLQKFKNILAIGETSSVEFKRCGNEVEHDVFESICSLHIGQGKPHIGPDKVHIERRVTALGFNQPTVEHISHLYTSIGFGCVFGRSEICRLTDLKERGASKLIDLMLRSRLIDTVKGQGKGKYRFRNFSEEA